MKAVRILVLTLLTLSLTWCSTMGHSIPESIANAEKEFDGHVLDLLEREDPNVQPRHVHLSRKYELTTMTVTWSTIDFSARHYVEWGSEESSLNQILMASTEVLNSRSSTGNGKQYIHEVTMVDLTPGQYYFYRCVSVFGMDNNTVNSDTHRFRVSLDGTDWSPNLLIFGDLGLTNPVTLPYLEEEINTDTYDAAFHIGDIAYQMNDLGGELGDHFMDSIESLATKVPYQVCVGNHDVDYFTDYNEYSKRFRMPGQFDSLVYSWNLGLIHFVAISTEYYFFSSHRIEEQYNWLVQDLEEANRNRNEVPWIIVYGHTPMYCSNDNTDSCTFVNSPLRVGCEMSLCHGLEDLFYQQGVDVQIYGHEHSYEALYPIYNYTVLNGSATEPYRNPKAPVHIITGSAGNLWEHDEFNETIPKPEWSRTRSIDYSYSRMKVLNASHLTWEQVAVPPMPRNGHADLRETWLIDRFTVIKDTHGPFPPL